MGIQPIMLILYTRPGCHLCEEALACIEAAEVDGTVRELDISADEQLTARFGVRIPVLQNTRTDREIDWPFTPADVLALREG